MRLSMNRYRRRVVYIEEEVEVERKVRDYHQYKTCSFVPNFSLTRFRAAFVRSISQLSISRARETADFAKSVNLRNRFFTFHPILVFPFRLSHSLKSTMLYLSALLSLLPIAYAALELRPNTSSTYPFAVHLPLNITSSPPPLLLFLHGSGSKGGVEDLGDKTRWDGVGWLISQFDSGNKTGAQAIVAENYL